MANQHEITKTLTLTLQTARNLQNFAPEIAFMLFLSLALAVVVIRRAFFYENNDARQSNTIPANPYSTNKSSFPESYTMTDPKAYYETFQPVRSYPSSDLELR